MIRLNLLGGIDLVGHEGASVGAILQQPKRLAVLAYVALAGPGAFRRRDTALALFWPEATQKKARLALNSTLHYLRQSLGDDVIVRRGPDEMGIARAALWCDAVEFDQALQRGDRVAALGLYRGDLLTGFFVDAGAEFERWLDGERDRLRRSAAAAAWRLGERAEQDAQLRAAAEWGRRSVELSLNNETSVQDLLGLLDRIGDRSGALQVYHAFVKQLAQEYDAEPSAATRQIAARLRSRSGPQTMQRSGISEQDTEIQPVAPIAVETDKAVRTQAGTQSSATASTERAVELPPSARENIHPAGARRRGSHWLFGTAAALCFLSVAGFMYTRVSRLSTSDGAYGRATVTVSQLTDIGAPAGPTHLGQVLTAAIVDQLAEVRSFDVIWGPSSTSIRAVSVGKPPHPQLLVSGSVIQSGGRVRVNVQIADAVSGKTIRTAVLDHPLRDTSVNMLPLIDSLSLRISSLVRTAVGHQVQLLAWSAGATNSKTYQLMQEADEGRDRADQLEHSGNSSADVRALESADSILHEVEAVAPRWAEPAIERARVLEQIGVSYLVPPLGDSTKVKVFLGLGMKEAARAVSLEPENASALESFGTLSYWYWITVPLPHDSSTLIQAQAIRALRGAVAADPSRSSAWSLLGSSLQASADYVDAYVTASRAYQADAYLTNPQEILSSLSTTAYEIGDDSASIRWCDEVNRRFERSWAGAYCQLSIMALINRSTDGDISRAWMIASNAGQGSSGVHSVEPHLRMLIAAIIARRGLRDSAEATIQRSRDQALGDAEILPTEADAQILLNRSDVAVDLLTEYMKDMPTQRAGVARSRRFSALKQFQQGLTARGFPLAMR